MSLKDRFNSVNAQPLNKTEIKEKIFQKPQETVEKVSSISILNTLLEDDEITSIYVNGAKNVYIERKKKLHKSTIAFKDNTQLENLIHKYAQLNNYKNERYINFVYRMGINAQATLPPLTDVPTLYIKCYKEKFANFETLEAQKTLSKEISLFLEALTKKNVNVIIAGNKKTFKTTLLNAIGNKTQTVNRCVNIDFAKEISIKKNNFTNYDFNSFENSRKTNEIIDSIINTNPEKIFINDCPEYCLNNIIKCAISGTKGIFLNICASSKKEALEKIIFEILKTTPAINYDLAKILAYKAFDFIIFVDDKEKREVVSVSEILLNEEKCTINDIFLANETKKHYSTGYVPESFLEEDDSAINLNIFNENYIHTYKEITVQTPDFKEMGINPEILKKFKKQEPKEVEETEEIEETVEIKEEVKEDIVQEENSKLEELISIKESFQNQATTESQEGTEISISDSQEFIKKAQEKFDEIRKRNLNNL